MKNNDNLSAIYKMGITDTWYKSNLISKINKLREALGMPPRSDAIPDGHYDAQVFKKPEAIDFSPLDTFFPKYNAAAWSVLKLAGPGLIPASEVPDDSASTVDLTGLGSDN